MCEREREFFLEVSQSVFCALSSRAVDFLSLSLRFSPESLFCEEKKFILLLSFCEKFASLVLNSCVFLCVCVTPSHWGPGEKIKRERGQVQ